MNYLELNSSIYLKDGDFAEIYIKSKDCFSSKDYLDLVTITKFRNELFSVWSETGVIKSLSNLRLSFECRKNFMGFFLVDKETKSLFLNQEIIRKN